MCGDRSEMEVAPARELVEGRGHVGRQPRGIDLELADDVMEVGVLELQDLVEPVNQLDVGIAAQLAERGRALDRLVGQTVQFSEEGNA